jgi:hypothetical protein
MKFLFFLLAVFFITIEISAIPRFAIKKGGMCFDCHTNPTGGNLRNSGGWGYGKNALPLVSPRKDYKMSNKISDNILLGFDFRGQYVGILREGTGRTDFQRMTGSVYTGVGISEEIEINARYDFIWDIWEAYAVARILPNESYIKGGSFTPNFGIRLDDHTAYTRGGDLGVVTQGQQQSKRGLIYDPRYVESGIELGINISDFGLFTASVGNSRQQLFTADPTYTASLQINPAIDDINFMIGGSAAIFSIQRFDPLFRVIYPQVKMFGGFAGIGFGNFSLMGELDFAHGYLSRDTVSTAMMIEGSYTIMKGVDAVVRYDRFDPSTKTDKNDLSRIVIGFEFHPYSFIEIRPQYRLQKENPEVKNDVFLVQFHFWY